MPHLTADSEQTFLTVLELGIHTELPKEVQDVVCALARYVVLGEVRIPCPLEHTTLYLGPSDDPFGIEAAGCEPRLDSAL
ncbi:hypothetical protein LB506_000200 [Fusarium annulatum]|nr:hypothetical protein LB506_000200 [Fusarium annulatum]